ncbi:uncharacterized protein AB675_5579 [Cyphellophora attinorum]|uniref:Uncharacterized protein n=1 Tax=Cyphellophora attinorum TaxID=1664694 RepID=A0A0N0NP51_9EURO|nr:uncharacterized protein AB675_5579 [Phialophora attinorum]KPI42129.1 hypothetical protein AB675_5579 [Phialophora attinorum]
METIEPDYLVCGAGAMGMAFVDTLVSDTTATIAIVDRYAQPGGHWTRAYPFVHLHHSSVFYGVNSRILGDQKTDVVGWNKGNSTMAPGLEVRAYYTNVMHSTFLPSGRVTYYPMHEYTGNGEFRSLLTSKTYHVGEKTKIVDATYMNVEVPSMRPPPYKISNEVEVIAPNNLPDIQRPYAGYTVVGSGKTSIDSCLWLLANGIDPAHITWIRPRDMWCFDRAIMQPPDRFRDQNVAASMATGEAIMSATSIDDMWLRLEKAGVMLRVDEHAKPTMWRCATISVLELEQLKRIKNVVRKGRLRGVSNDQVTLESGSYTPVADSIYIDCSANSIPKQPSVPIFNGRHITLQPVRACQQVFSAAVIAHIEATYDDEKFKNDLTTPIPHPEHPDEYPGQRLQTLRNEIGWRTQPKTAAFVANSRLDVVGAMNPLPPSDPREREKFQAVVAAAFAAQMEKLEMLARSDSDREHSIGQKSEMAEARL